MPQIFVNNARARLAQAISASQTSIQLLDRVGLPNSLASGDWFLLSISRNDSRYGSNHEVVRVTGVSGDTITVVRGQEGAAVPHDVSEVVEARSTAGSYTRMLREAVWAHVSDKPDMATRWPTWGEVTGKPATFAPSAHTHPWAEITAAPATATRWPTWSEVTSKPTTFAPSAHGHAWSDIAEAPATATRWPTYAEVTDKPATTASRTSTSTTMLLQAGGMNDHRLSGDHDDRYYTKSLADGRYALLGSANTLTQDLAISRPSAATAGVTLTGGRTGDAGAVGSLTLVNAEDGNVSGSLAAWRRAAGTLDLEIAGFAKTKLASAVEAANNLTVAGTGYQALDLRSSLSTGALGGIRWYTGAGTLAGELRFTATGGVEVAQGAQFTGNGAGLTNLSAGALASGTVPAARLSGSYTLNASTASALETSRTINGTGFNGTANITTALWGTARTFTIGSTGKSVNGSANVSWSLAEIGAAEASHTHPWAEVTGAPTTATRWPTWSEVTSKPSTFTPASHTHGEADLPNASTSAVGVVQLNNTVTSTSATQAATANAAKLANDNANNRIAKSGDAMTGLLSGRPPQVVTALSALTATTPSINCGYVSVPNTGTQYAPMLHGRSHLSGAGYVQHVSMGHKRTASAWGNFYIAVGGNDSYPTREWLFHGGTGAMVAPGAVSATSFSGSGAGLTALNASNLTSGTVANARLPTTATRWPTWSEVSSKPTTFTPSAHSHFDNHPQTTSTTNIGLENERSCIAYVSNPLLGANDGALYSHVYNSSWKHQIQGDYRTGQIAVRGKNNNVWQAWRTVLDSSNFFSWAAPTGRAITAGNGLSGGGDLSANRTITLGTPSSITATSTNSVTATSHTHEISSATVLALTAEAQRHAVGTYTIGSSYGATSANATLAGSSIVLCVPRADRTGTHTESACNMYRSTTTHPGTWRNMSWAPSASRYEATLWLRIA